MTIETEVAHTLAHRVRIAKVLERTGGEIIHPDHYDLREAIRTRVLEAIDAATVDQYGRRIMSDGELPELFEKLDAIAERIFLKGSGL